MPISLANWISTRSSRREASRPSLPPEIFVRRAARATPAVDRRARRSQRARTRARASPPGWVLGKYRLERTIGMGGFGAVYRARHVVLDNVVAIKLMRPSVIRSRPALLRLLTEEARFAARIDHPNVVRVHDVATSNEHTYIVMEHVDGPDLGVMIKRRGALPLHDGGPASSATSRRRSPPGSRRTSSTATSSRPISCSPAQASPSSPISVSPARARPPRPRACAAWSEPPRTWRRSRPAIRGASSSAATSIRSASPRTTR